MVAKYDHKSIEEKWMKEWEKDKLFHSVSKSKASGSASGAAGASLTRKGKKRYMLFALPYPSGSGLHVGHVESKTALDILSRYYRMQGERVFFPVGWDAFGLPAENYAIKTGTPPDQTTKKAIKTFVKQIKRLGISYAWDTETSTAHPGYYKWTQWIFLQLYRKGLAHKAPGMVNWCPSCKTALANEQVVNGLCERCDNQVIQKEMEQWYFRITKYLDELISGLEKVDWPAPTVEQQLNWIGKKNGVNITYPITSKGRSLQGKSVTCFTTRPDTNYGATFVVVAPEYAKKHLMELVPKKHQSDVEEYVKKASKKSELERISDGTKKTGVFTGLYAVNQLNDYEMPIYVADFVLSTVGTGAVVGVPGHDLRDFQFAKAFDLEIKRVVVASDGKKGEITKGDQVQEEEGVMVNSEFLDGMDIHSATKKMIDHLVKKGWGKKVTTYRMRDWLISRQRYWGAPIPIVYDPKGKPHPVKTEHLPWMLPTDVDYNPKGTSPLGSSKELKARVEKLYGKGWTPEIDTMDTFVDSSWYFLRYTDPRNEKEFASKAKMKDLLPVDFYMIGPEHIVLHLLYARFFTKFLRDEGHLDFDEPFLKMRHQGIIMGPDGKRMSKSRGNVINPDDYIKKYGADTLRMYEMFMGPLTDNKDWDVYAIVGPHRLLTRIHKLAQIKPAKKSDKELEVALHKLVQKVTQDIPNIKFNTAISSTMGFVNLWEAKTKSGVGLTKSELVMFVRLLAPFAPFLAEDIWQEVLGEKKSVHLQRWPSYDPKLVEDEEVDVIVQVNGKLRATLQINSRQATNKSEVVKLAKTDQKVSKWLKGRIKKEIFVPGKLVNFVI